MPSARSTDCKASMNGTLCKTGGLVWIVPSGTHRCAWSCLSAGSRRSRAAGSMSLRAVRLLKWRGMLQTAKRIAGPLRSGLLMQRLRSLWRKPQSFLKAQEPAFHQNDHDRRGIAIATIRYVRGDLTMSTLVKQADAARDARDYAVALNIYSTILEQAPLHGGYRIQAGHCFKEMRCYVEAEVCYRDGIALGQPLAQVLEHLEFAAWRAGWTRPPYPPEPLALLMSDEPSDEGIGRAAFGLRLATSADVEACLVGLLEEPNLSIVSLADWLRRGPETDALLAAIISTDDFIAGNAALIAAAGEGVGK